MSSLNQTIPSALSGTHFLLPGQQNFYKGKVRDVYTVDGLLIMVVTDRISAFDVVLPRAIPFKGQVLNQVASTMLKATEDIVPNWLLEIPDPNVSIGRICSPFKVEMVIRGYLSGHAWREYKAGRKQICGVKLMDGLNENDRFPYPVITPTTKAAEGHDQDISKDEIIRQGIVDKDVYEKMEDITRNLFLRGTELAEKQGLILVDTKYEFGMLNGKIMLIDEIHTPDSSRYFYADGYAERQLKGLPQKQLSKEFVRQWLIDNNFQGRKGDQIPEMNDSWVLEISKRYIELYEKLTGLPFKPAETSDMLKRIENNILMSINKLKSVH